MKYLIHILFFWFLFSVNHLNAQQCCCECESLPTNLCVTQPSFGSCQVACDNFCASLASWSVGACAVPNGSPPPCDIPLPVDLLNFKILLSDQHKIKLIWQTQLEVNNLGFDIERSPDGYTWARIGFQPGGNSEQLRTYEFEDPFPMAGINYYRLKQLDLDGDFTYSKTITGANSATSQMVLNPNPATHKLVIRINDDTFRDFSIYNYSGQLVKIFQAETSGKIDLNISKLPPGIYRIIAKGTNAFSAATFIKIED